MSESQPLLGQAVGGTATRPHKLWKFVALVALLMCIVLTVLLATTKAHDPSRAHFNVPKTKKNVIFMVTDGMGPALLLLARSFRQHRDSLPLDNVLTIDRFLIGLSRTRSSSSLVTDLAAGATAFSCALKSYNGAIGVSPDKQPCGTILEALKLQGYKTGLVVTTRITDATPGAFSAHVNYRSQEDQIAEQQLWLPLFNQLMVDLMIGGGRCHFLPLSAGGCRSDSRDLVHEAKAHGWHYFGDRRGFDKVYHNDTVSLPLLGLVADTDIPYDVDRKASEYPSLKEQVQLALRALTDATRDLDQGFFLMIEGSRIDHAGHHNDAAAQVREVLAYDEALAEVIDYIDNLETDTVMVSTLDHETGGLVTARQVLPGYPDYLWYPQVLLDATHSGEYVSSLLFTEGKKDAKHVKKVVAAHLGIHDLTKDEVAKIVDALDYPGLLLYTLNDLVSVRLQTGWTTHGHLAVDVNIYGHSNARWLQYHLDALRGNHENIEIGSFMERITGANLLEITTMVKHADHKPRHARAASVGDGYHENI